MPNPQSKLRDWLRYRSQTNPDRLALICGTEQVTFQQLDRAVDGVATLLVGKGIQPGDRVAIWLPNCIAYAHVIHAISRIGAISVPINRRLTKGEIVWQLEDVDASWLVVDDESARLVEEFHVALPALGVMDVHELTAASPGLVSRYSGSERFNEWHEEHAIHTIMYTSGTTCRPKGAILTYSNHWWSAMGSALNLGIHADDRWLAVLPFFHVGGLSILMRSVIYGITTVIHSTFEPGEINRSISENRITIISLVSTMLQRMLKDLGDSTYPESLRCVLLGGGPAPKPVLDACAARNIPVSQTYGLTETASQLATLAPEEALTRLGSAGKPLYPNEIVIAGENQLETAGHPGEILVRGPVVTAGYYQRPDDTDAAMQDGWFRTGDIGLLDEDGYLFVLDRRDDLIVTGGENVYPAEVEAVLGGHPEIAEAAVIGVPDSEWGQKIVAIICPHSRRSLDIAALVQYCRAHLAGYKVPVNFVVRTESLPRNAAGKLLRRSLRSTLSDDPRELC